MYIVLSQDLELDQNSQTHQKSKYHKWLFLRSLEASPDEICKEENLLPLMKET